MRLCKKIACLLACTLVCLHLFSQENLQFIENKGQWDNKIKYQGAMSNGAFALEATGYRVLLHNTEDLAALSDISHTPTAVKVETKIGSAGVTPVDLPAGGKSSSASASVTLRSHTYEMRFLNANAAAQIVPDKALATYSNYFIGNDPSKWTSNCRTFQAITYKNIYPNIDVRYYTAGGSLKYDFIIHPGGNVGDITMYFDGVESLKTREGAVVVKTSVGEIRELPPYSYQLTDEKRVEVPCSYDVKGNIVRFHIDGEYAKSATLVIDPTLVFSTFTGSTADNWGYTATYDGQGNFYSGGIVFGGSGSFPVSNGAFQTKYQGGSTGTGEKNGFDIGIMKFDASGANRVYATYIGGGTGNEQPHSLVVDGAGNLVLAGRTTSTDYPTAGALKTFGTPAAGTWHIVLTKLNASGSALIGSVVIGGKALDGANINHKYAMSGALSTNRNYGDDARSEVILDGSGNIFYASCTQSSDFPVTAASAQATINGPNASGRSQDAVVIKMAPDLSAVLFSVLIGGKDDDAAFVLAINPQTGNLFVGGATASTDFPGSKTTAKYGTFQGGATDGFVAELTNTGTLVRSSYFGTSGNDMLYGIQFDKFGFPYIMGTTTGAWPVTNAKFSQTNGKQFIVKLKPDLSDYIYSTVFGTTAASPNLSPTAFLVDRCENVYVSGWGGTTNSLEGYPNSGTTGLPVTSDAYQKTTDGSDFYFFVLEKNANSQLYGSFFGQNGGFGEHVDGGTSRFDRNGVIYQALCANCNSQPRPKFPTTPGVWAPNNGSIGCNLAAVKIAFNLAGIGAGIQASVNGVPHDTAGCVPVTVVLTDTVAQGKQYLWDYNDGSKMDTTTAPTTTHTFATIGLYRVRLIAVDSSSCNVTDTSFVTMRVRDDLATLAFTSAKIPPCTSLTYQFTNNSTAIKPFKSNSFRWDFGDGASQLAGSGSVTHTYTAAGTYNIKLVLIDTNYCNEPDSITQSIRIASNLKAQFVTPASGCVPYTALFDNTSIGGQSFAWDFGDGTTSTQTSPSHLYPGTGTYTIRLIATDTATCNKIDSTSMTITVNDNPSSSFVYSPQPTVPNDPVVFQNSSLGAVNYKWLFGDGDTLVTSRADVAVSHLYNATGTFNTCLVAINSSGCADTSCQSVSVIVIPGVDVPNAFSPNGDGINDKIYVRGYGISKMTWRIYNRWGAVVYLGTDVADGWDGTFKGKLQPQDVYHYTLDVEFSSHEKASKKGDITLLR